jgi:hypothetical protein
MCWALPPLALEGTERPNAVCAPPALAAALLVLAPESVRGSVQQQCNRRLWLREQSWQRA